MIRIASAALAAVSLAVITPSLAATALANGTDAPFVVAQGFDVHIGGGDRDRDGYRERRIIREHRVHDFDDRGRCRTVIVRRHTPDGMVTRRTRTCD